MLIELFVVYWCERLSYFIIEVIDFHNQFIYKF